MYLSRLDHKQKELFLDLCIHASMSDNEFSEEEKAIIFQYCAEMQLSDIRYEAKHSTDEVIEELVEISSPDELRIILMEITALVISDNACNQHEQRFMDKLVEKIGVSNEELSDLINSLNALSSVYEKINIFIFGKE